MFHVEQKAKVQGFLDCAGMTTRKAMDSMIEMVGTAGFEPTTSTV